MQLGEVRLLVNDFDGCFRFYRDVLGLTLTWGAEGEVYSSFTVGEGGPTVALFARALMAAVVDTAGLADPATTQDRVLLAFDVGDLAATVTMLEGKGVTFLTAPADRPDWGIRTVHLRDPDGTLIELFSRLPMPE
ncbi:MAG: VOC family protein [Chloroflexota bacterium]|nr:VOC family protein [Chloroflexota bacterium]